MTLLEDLRKIRKKIIEKKSIELSRLDKILDKILKEGILEKKEKERVDTELTIIIMPLMQLGEFVKNKKTVEKIITILEKNDYEKIEEMKDLLKDIESGYYGEID